MIWFEVMPAAMADWIEDFVKVAVSIFGYRVFRFAKSERMEISKGEEV